MMKKYFRISFFSFAVSRRSDWRWLQFALIATVLTSCTVQMKVKEVTSLPVPKQQVERTRSAAAPWPRLFWEQIEAADTLGAIAVADNDGNGYWSDSLRWESGVLKLGIDTAATRAYARSVSAGGGSTQDLFSQFTDVLGFSPAVADDPNDVLTFRSPNSTISFSAWNDDATYGDYLAFDLASNAVSWSSLKAAVQDSIQLERGADGNGVFDVSNSGSSVPDNMTLDVTDEIIFSTENINQNPVMVFDYDAGGSYSTPGFIEFNLNETTAPSLGTISDLVTLDNAGVQKFYWRYVSTASAEQLAMQSEVSWSIGSGDDFTLWSDADLIIGDGGETDILVNFSSIQNTPTIDNILVLNSSTNVLGYRDISTLGTDDQTIDVFSITSNTLNLSLEDDAEATKTVDLSPYLDNTDAQTLSFSSPNLTITGGNSVDISAIQDGTGTDDQNISGSGLSGTNLTIGIEGGSNEVVDLATLQDGTGTDDQTIDVFSITSNTLNLSLESDGEATKTVSLLPYLDNTDTQLTEEQVEDFIGGMVTGNTESGITVTYQDTDGTLDFLATDNSTVNESWWIQGDTGSEAGIKADDGAITFAGGTNVTTAYNSTSNTLTINATGGSSSNLYDNDGTLAAARTVDLDGKVLRFEDNAITSSFQVETGNQSGLFVIKDQSAADSLAFRYDYASGGYSLESLGSTNINFIAGDAGSVDLGDGDANLRIYSDIEYDSTVTQILVKDPITRLVKYIDQSRDRVSDEETTTVTAVAGVINLVNVTSGTATVTPPSTPESGTWFAVSDSRGNASTNNITVDLSTDKYHTDAVDYTMNTDNAFARFTYVDSTVGWIRSF